MRREDSEWWRAGFTQEWWRGLSQTDRFLFLETLTDDEVEDFYKDWRVWGRDNQLAPEGIWRTWLLLAGRGFGKTRALCEFIRDEVMAGKAGRIALVGQGESDIREVLIEGDSGLLSISKRDERPDWRPSMGAGRLIWPNGATAYVYSAMDPESLRGPQFELGVFDEPMAVPAEQRQKAVSNLRFGLRKGRNPRLVYATTPKPHRWLREELAKAKKWEDTPALLRKYVLTRGSTMDNRENLAESFFEGILEDYDGTNLGRQEIYAEILGDEEGALWTEATLDKGRLTDMPTNPEERLIFLKEFVKTCDKVVIGVDPNIKASSKTAHAAGIVVCAKRGLDRYVVDDWSIGGGPAKWGERAVQAFIEFQADEIVPEVNQGGDMVRMVINDAAREIGVDVKIHEVHATRGKQRRAEPVAAAYERGAVHHLGTVGSTLRPGPFFKLESQMCALHDLVDPTGEDFDRCDAAVWGMTRLGLKNRGRTSGAGMPIMTFGENT